MELFPPGRLYDFMSWRFGCILISALLVLGSVVLFIYPGPKLGTDFRGGTEVEVSFKKPLNPGQIREALKGPVFSSPEIVAVDDPRNPNRFLIRVQEVSVIGAETRAAIERVLCMGENLPQAECPLQRAASEVKFSPGGDKITVRFQQAPDLEWVRQRIANIPQIALRKGANNPTLQSAREHKVEIQLESKGDQMMSLLRDKLGPDTVPETALRAEWIGPKAGKLLRDAALKSIVISLIFIMAYIALRFDLRFAPGGIVALIHDSMIAVGSLILLGREINLVTVAAVLTIIGYSINDTVVVYDRVRENLGKLRGISFSKLINISISEMLGRTMITNGTVVFSLLAFFVWGTGTLKDFALTLVIGVVAGTYSSIYIALPLTEVLDKLFFSKIATSKRRPTRKPAAATV
jgi:preprotein translocase subunit SecF